MAEAFYGVVDAAGLPLQEVATLIGARHVPELDVAAEGRELRRYVLVHGRRGLVGRLQELIHAEQDVPLADPGTAPAVDAEQLVRRALREFHDPVALAALPLARGETVPIRADSVRQDLGHTMALAFSPSEADKRLGQLITRSCLDQSGGQQRAMAESHLSRTSYYRHLGLGVRRLAAAWSSGDTGPSRPAWPGPGPPTRRYDGSRNGGLFPSCLSSGGS